MRIVNEEKLRVLYADDGKVLKSKEDNYEKEYIDEGNNVIKEHIPYYFTIAYVPPKMTLEKATELYDEINENEQIKSTN